MIGNLFILRLREHFRRKIHHIPSENPYTEEQMAAVRVNELIDSQIISGEVTSEVLERLPGAYKYDAATAISWLVTKLRLVRTTLSEKSVKVNSAIPVVLRNEEDLKEWVNEYFPEILPDSLK